MQYARREINRDSNAKHGVIIEKKYEKTSARLFNTNMLRLIIKTFSLTTMQCIGVPFTWDQFYESMHAYSGTLMSRGEAFLIYYTTPGA